MHEAFVFLSKALEVAFWISCGLAAKQDNKHDRIILCVLFALLAVCFQLVNVYLTS